MRGGHHSKESLNRQCTVSKLLPRWVRGGREFTAPTYALGRRLEITSSLGARRTMALYAPEAKATGVSKLLPRWVRGGLTKEKVFVDCFMSRNYFLAGCEEDYLKSELTTK